MHQHASQATMDRMPARKLVVSESERDISAACNIVGMLRCEGRHILYS